MRAKISFKKWTPKKATQNINISPITRNPPTTRPNSCRPRPLIRIPPNSRFVRRKHYCLGHIALAVALFRRHSGRASLPCIYRIRPCPAFTKDAATAAGRRRSSREGAAQQRGVQLHMHGPENAKESTPLRCLDNGGKLVGNLRCVPGNPCYPPTARTDEWQTIVGWMMTAK